MSFSKYFLLNDNVTDKTLGTEKSINYQIVRDISVLNTVLDTTIMQALEGAIDREGPGTALMSISMDCSSKKGENYNFRRENLFYSKTDICQVLTNEVTSLVDMISESEYDDYYVTMSDNITRSLADFRTEYRLEYVLVSVDYN